MTTERKILEYFYDKKINWKSRYERPGLGLFDLFKSLTECKYQTLANNCTFLQKKGLIRKGSNSDYYITQKGVEHLESSKVLLKEVELKVDINAPKNLIVIYDIPQDQKKERDWFRRHLRRLNFEMIQKSVWVGPSPLPKEFLEYVDDIGIKETFKTFKLSKGYKNK